LAGEHGNQRSQAATIAAMSTTQKAMAGFAAAERDYIRSELDLFFSTLPSRQELGIDPSPEAAAAG